MWLLYRIEQKGHGKRLKAMQRKSRARYGFKWNEKKKSTTSIRSLNQNESLQRTTCYCNEKYSWQRHFFEFKHFIYKKKSVVDEDKLLTNSWSADYNLLIMGNFVQPNFIEWQRKNFVRERTSGSFAQSDCVKE